MRVLFAQEPCCPAQIVTSQVRYWWKRQGEVRFARAGYNFIGVSRVRAFKRCTEIDFDDAARRVWNVYSVSTSEKTALQAENKGKYAKIYGCFQRIKKPNKQTSEQREIVRDLIGFRPWKFQSHRHIFKRQNLKLGNTEIAS